MPRFTFTSPSAPARIFVIPASDANALELRASGAGPAYTIEVPDAPAAIITLDASLLPASVAFQLVVDGPRWYLPADCTVTPMQPALPNGGAMTLGGDLASLTVTAAMSNMTIDLHGHRIGLLTLADGAHRIRVTNGRVGRMATSMHSLDPFSPVAVEDVTIDNIRFEGGLSTGDGNGLRIARLHIANCSSVAASSPTALDGLHSTCVWGDPGSHDWLIHDCHFATRGAEACIRLMDTARSVVHNCTLSTAVTVNPTGPANKHCYRIHGFAIGPDGQPRSTDSWISDCELINHGMMLGTLPDNTPQPAYDIVRNAWVRRCRITMARNSPVVAASFQFPSTTMTPAGPRQGSGMQRMVGAHVENLEIWGSYDQVGAFARIALANPQLGWVFANNVFHQL